MKKRHILAALAAADEQIEELKQRLAEPKTLPIFNDAHYIELANAVTTVLGCRELVIGEDHARFVEGIVAEIGSIMRPHDAPAEPAADKNLRKERCENCYYWATAVGPEACCMNSGAVHHLNDWCDSWHAKQAGT